MSEELPTIKKKKPSTEPVVEYLEPGMVMQKPHTSVPIKERRISVPHCEIELGYTKRRFDVRLGGAEAVKIKQIAFALTQKSAKLQNGKYVESGSDAIRWILENL